ncbi:creatininase family protein [Dorea sp. D27]|uniref:creatininase family protein n=1 Tax=Dorea sp. D27 TaxID=658665 RepID=UPI0006734D13|nr:creatininase family protein [Dorea sp. D27]KMZ52797.1 putative creatinine amidohydrolase [Dorea sp. D27]
MTNFIFENTWEENEEAVKTKKLAIIPVGSTEQHGPALPVGTDWMVARYLAEQIGKETDKGLVAPVIPYGHALYHADFTGTMAVSQTTLTAYVKEVCQQLVSYGFTHFLFVNGHGGNNNALYDVGQYLRLQNIPAANMQWFEVAGCLNPEWGLIGHGDITETSVMMHIAPDMVKVERAHIPQNRKIGNIQLLDLHRGEFEGADIYLNLRTRDVSKTGDLIEHGHSAGVDYSRSAEDASAELGKAVCEAVVGYTLRFIDEFVNFEFEYII